MGTKTEGGPSAKLIIEPSKYLWTTSSSCGKSLRLSKQLSIRSQYVSICNHVNAFLTEDRPKFSWRISHPAICKPVPFFDNSKSISAYFPHFFRPLPPTRPALFLPSLPTFNPPERALVGAWKSYLKWEECNPLKVEEKDRATLVSMLTGKRLFG
jgi:hypothetical protein